MDYIWGYDLAQIYHVADANLNATSPASGKWSAPKSLYLFIRYWTIFLAM